MSNDDKKSIRSSQEIPTLEKEKDVSFDNEKITAEVEVVGADIQALGSDVVDAMKYAETMSHQDVEECLRYILLQHDDDPNFPSHALLLAKQYLYDDEIKNDPIAYARLYDEVKVEAAMVANNSAYAEVRAVVQNTDDPNTPVLTFRAWSVGLIYVVIGAFLNQFFSIRQPGILIYSNVAQMLSYPVGVFMARVLPTRTFMIFGNECSLNPGPFNPKEHIIITIMANVGFTQPYTKNVIWVQYADRFFGQSWVTNFGYQILISLSTNFIGYGIAGLTRRFLVYPSIAVWPTTLATIALNRAFHSGSNPVVSGWKMSRMRFFSYAFTAMFIYFWFPNFIFEALTYFNWMTWIAPDNVMLAAVTGTVTGLGINPIPTLDWNSLVYLGDPLVNPFFTTANYFFGALLTAPLILIFWVKNIWYTAHLPINSNGVFDNTGKRYNVSRTIDDRGLFDQASFEAYSPAYLAASNILLYGFFFAVYSSTISHVYLSHRRELVNGLKSLFRRQNLKSLSRFDVHSRIMATYPEVPEWHYLCVLAVSIGLGAAGIGAYPTYTTPAVVLYGIFLALIFCIPIGIIKAVTNAEITLNVIAEFFGGLWFPGNATAMNFFKSYGYVTTAHTIAFAQDLKLAHYMHIPPRATFWAQMVATFISTFVCVGILNFQMTQIPDVCSPTQVNRFTCPGQNTFFTASVLWGTLGPARMFGHGAIYNPLIWGFPIGFVLPFFFFYLRKRVPIFKYFNIPVFFAGALIWAPYNLAFIWPAVPVAYFFNVWIKKRHLGWWSKYTYILASAFACAIAISAIIQFFGLQFKAVTLDWVGNTIPYAGCDGKGCPLKPVAAGSHFGPGVGEFH